MEESLTTLSVDVSILDCDHDGGTPVSSKSAQVPKVQSISHGPVMPCEALIDSFGVGCRVQTTQHNIAEKSKHSSHSCVLWADVRKVNSRRKTNIKFIARLYSLVTSSVTAAG